HLPVNRLDSALELRALLFKGRGEHWLSGHFDRAELVEVELPPVRSGGADGGTQTVFLDLRFDTPPHLAGSHPGSAAGTVLDSLGCGPDKVSHSDLRDQRIFIDVGNGLSNSQIGRAHV